MKLYFTEMEDKFFGAKFGVRVRGGDEKLYLIRAFLADAPSGEEGYLVEVYHSKHAGQSGEPRQRQGVAYQPLHREWIFDGEEAAITTYQTVIRQIKDGSFSENS